MSQPQFHTWMDMCALQRKQNKSLRKESVKEIYGRLTYMFDKHSDYSSVKACNYELEWYRLGNPYYKIWPLMAQHLAHVNLDFDCKFLHLPFPTYEIRLPKDPPFREGDKSPTLRSLLVSEDRTPQPGRQWTLNVAYQFDVDLAENYMGWYFRMGLKDGIKLEDQIVKTFDKSSPYSDGYTPSLEMCRGIVRLAVSVAMFGLNQHELIMPDLPRKILTRIHKAKQDNKESEAKKELERAKRMGCFGWKVGSEIDLPTPLIKHETADSDEEPSYHLQFGHVRRGHMRLQPYGKRDEPERYELIFIPPTVVRPDLPLRDMRGFRIRDTALGGQSHEI